MFYSVVEASFHSKLVKLVIRKGYVFCVWTTFVCVDLQFTIHYFTVLLIGLIIIRDCLLISHWFTVDGKSRMSLGFTSSCFCITFCCMFSDKKINKACK